LRAPPIAWLTSANWRKKEMQPVEAPHDRKIGIRHRVLHIFLGEVGEFEFQDRIRGDGNS